MSESRAAYLSAYASVNGYSGVNGCSGVTPVPEPHTWAMLFAGLGLLGGVAMRRARA